MGSVTDNWYLSGELHIESDASNRPDKDAWQQHFGHANIWGKFTKIATSRMWGLQNSYGILQSWESDSLFIGLKDEGSNRKDAVIAFGDDADESLRFLFAGAGFPPSPPKELLRITGSGNVGIGTVNPQAPLEIKGGSGGTFQIGRNNLAFEGGNEGGNLHIESREGMYLNYYSNKPIFLGQGRVGIGTTIPKGTLHLKGNEGVLSIEGADHGYIQFYPQGSVTRRGWIGSGSTGDKSFTLSSDAERMHITGGENLYLLNTGGVFVSKAWGGNGNLAVDGEITLAAQGTIKSPGRMHITGDENLYLLNKGGVLISKAWGGNGNLSVDGSIVYGGQLNKLDVAEGDYARIRATDLLFGHSSRRGDVGRALVDEPRDLVVDVFGKKQHFNTLVINYGRDWGAVVIEGLVQTPSSRQLKENICMLSSQVAKNIISTLEPVSFTYKQDTLKLECLGFIAEDAPPEVTLPTKDTITFNHIVAALTRVVKDQEQSITELNLQIKMLKNSIFNTN